MEPNGAQAGTSKLAIIVQQGKVLDFIDGETQRSETPEEYVRQEIAKSLVREYGYAKADIEVEFTVRIGSRKPRVDLVIFPSGTEHTQEKAIIIVECKASTVKSADKKDGVGQLQSYMAACPNVTYGMWTNGVERFCYRRVVKGGTVNIEDVPDLPEFGRKPERKPKAFPAAAGWNCEARISRIAEDRQPKGSMTINSRNPHTTSLSISCSRR